MLPVEKILGRGLITPFRREGGDLANSSGSEVVASAVKQIMKTRKGDLRWRHDFGLGIDTYRHRNITNEMMAGLEAEITDQIQKYEPRLEIQYIEVRQKDVSSNYVVIRIQWRAVTSKKASGGGYLTDVQTTEVEI